LTQGGAATGEEWLAAVKRDGLEVDLILVSLTKLARAVCKDCFTSFGVMQLAGKSRAPA
jgi:hypothetical protein